MGRVAQASAAAAGVVAQWQAFLLADPNVEQFNAKLPEVGKLTNGVKAQVAHLLNEHIKVAGWKLDKEKKTYYRPQKDLAATFAEPVPEPVAAVEEW